MCGDEANKRQLGVQLGATVSNEMQRLLLAVSSVVLAQQSSINCQTESFRLNDIAMSEGLEGRPPRAT